MDLAQAYFLLKSLKENIPNTSEVEQKWVDDFHSILDTVGKETGADLSAFRVEASDLHRPIVGGTRAYARHGRIVRGQVRYGSKTVVERARLMHKADAVLGYFKFNQGTGDEPKRSVSFGKAD